MNRYIGSFAFGCGGLLIVLAVTIATMVYLKPFERSTARGNFPEGVHLGALVHSHSQSGGREGCSVTAFRLDHDDVRLLQADATAYLTGLARVSQRGRELSEWRETPRMVQSRRTGELLVGEGVWSCDNTQHHEIDGALRAVRQPGSYYATFSHEEGILYLIPSQRMAVVLYFG